jgi:hypothetical protein
MNKNTIRNAIGAYVTLCDHFMPRSMTSIGIVQDSRNGIWKSSSHEITSQIEGTHTEESTQKTRSMTGNLLCDFMTSLPLITLFFVLDTIKRGHKVGYKAVTQWHKTKTDNGSPRLPLADFSSHLNAAFNAPRTARDSATLTSTHPANVTPPVVRFSARLPPQVVTANAKPRAAIRRASWRSHRTAKGRPGGWSRVGARASPHAKR